MNPALRDQNLYEEKNELDEMADCTQSISSEDNQDIQSVAILSTN